MKAFKLLLTSVFVLLLVGCGSGDDQKDDQQLAETFDMDKVTYQVPEGVNLIDSKIEGVTAKMMSVGANEELVAFIQQLSTTTATAKASKSYKVMQKGVEDAFNQLHSRANSGEGSIDSISLFSSQNFQMPYTFTIAQYKLTTNKEIEPLTLAGEILTTLSGGTAKGIPLAANNAPVDTLFRLILLYGEYEATTFYIAVVVPEALYSKYQTESDIIMNAARVRPKGKKLTTLIEKFTQAEAKQNVDILFVVDDSGSMSDNQDALSQAADDFSTKMTNSGLTWRAAIITTGNGATDHTNGAAYSILRNYGIIENNATLLKQALVAGTGGSSTETGIWNAEQALQSVAHGDSFDGAVIAAGMPKAGSTLSVIIMSDEKSQYTSRSTNGTDFNVSNNLFKDRGIRVYSLIETDSYSLSRSQYDDLSLETGGIYSNIENVDANGSLDFSGFMEQIAQDAGGVASSFALKYAAVVINEVKVDGVIVNPISSNNPVNGYTYSQSSQSIVFHGTAVPASGQSIEVTYEYYQ